VSRLPLPPKRPVLESLAFFFELFEKLNPGVWVLVVLALAVVWVLVVLALAVVWVLWLPFPPAPREGGVLDRLAVPLVLP